jgi:uncharacterized membrane protein HdeD (DUF308 family)
MSAIVIKPGNQWSNLLMNAIITLIIGSILIFVPTTVYKTLILVLGAIMLASGISFIIYVHRANNIEVKAKVIWYGQAIINISIGLMMLIQPDIILKFMYYFISIWLILIGAIQLFFAPSQKTIIGKLNIMLINSILSISFGVLFLIWPTFPLQIMGVIFSIIGLILLYYSFIFYKHRSDVITMDYNKIAEE